MRKKILVSTPSRICLFGEHQDYLGLEVIASAINLRFHAAISKRDDSIIYITTCGEKNGKFNNRDEVIENEKIFIDISKPIIYQNNRDYLASTVNVLLKHGYTISHGFDIELDSEIPIGKGMSSSTTMVVVLIKALFEAINAPDKDDAQKIANLAFEAEVLEFNEPGGMMDQYASALGGLLHICFDKDETRVERINKVLPGCFILFDSKEKKDTTRVLANAKTPVIKGLKKLQGCGINSIRDFISNENNIKYLDKLDSEEKIKILANIDNYKILKEAEKMLKSDSFLPSDFGNLLKRHHKNLRDGLNISTASIEKILETSYKNGALGGKINGSGGGGCLYVYTMEEDAQRILNAVKTEGFIGNVIKQDTGVRFDGEC